jgi:hypothetical protein
MELKPRELIHGIRPSALKSLLSGREFYTPYAMRLLRLRDPDASRVLARLCADKLISFDGTTDDFYDSWTVTQSGGRFGAARIGKRFSIEEGRAIVSQAVQRARALNAEPFNSERITKMMLFGSVLVPDGRTDAGDVDLVVETRKRQFDNPDFEAKCAAFDFADAPEYLGFIDRAYWPGSRLQKAIKRISNKISLHSESDVVSIGAPFRVIYGYDISAEAELDLSGEIELPPKQAQADEPRSEEWQAATSRACLNPVPLPRRTVAYDRQYGEMPYNLTLKHECTCAEHQWTNGAPLECIIARSTRPWAIVQHLWAEGTLPKRITKIVEVRVNAIAGN